MEKIKRYNHISSKYYETDDYYSIEEIRSIIDNAEKKGATHIDFELDSCDSGDVTFNFSQYRLETDEEFEKRVIAMNKQKQLTDKIELEMFKKLKEKYGE
jgi:hypothetical protein